MRAIVLTRDKKAIRKRVNSKRSDWEFRKAIYILDPQRVQNYTDSKGEIRGQEMLFFEENPNPIYSGEESDGKQKDLSSKYLDEIVIINFIQQTTDTMRDWNMPGFGFLNWFTENPVRIPFALMIGFVLWTLAKNYLGLG